MWCRAFSRAKLAYMHTNSHWRLCSTCKNEISFGQRYWTCSVSTCNRVHTALVFCSLPCWESHVPMMRHRDAWADEQRAPHRQGQGAEQPHAAAPAATSSKPPAGRTAVRDHGNASGGLPRDILIVASKMKNYIKAKSGMNTSERVLEPLSDKVRELCDDAIERARAEGRKTVLDRDF